MPVAWLVCSCFAVLANLLGEKGFHFFEFIRDIDRNDKLVKLLVVSMKNGKRNVNQNSQC